MPFLAQCPFCPTKVRVHNEALGTSIACPQCRNQFTLAPISDVAVPTDSQHLLPRLGRAIAAQAQAKARPAGAAPVPGSTPGPAQPGQPLPPVPETRAPLSPWGVAAFLLAAFGLVSASFSPLYVLVIPLSALALLVGLLGALAWQEWNGRSLALTAGGGGLGFVVLLLAVFWPGVFGAGFALRGQRPAEGAAAGLLQDQGRRADDADWLDASAGPVQSQNVQLQVLGAGLERVELANPKGLTLSKKPAFVVRLRLTNVGSGQPVQYAGWGTGKDGKPVEPRLTDDLGKACAFRQRLPEGEIKGRAVNAVLVPGRKLEDLLVFDAPSARAESYRLELPAAAWGGEGSVRLRLSRQAPPTP